MRKENKFLTVFSVFMLFIYFSGYLLYKSGTLNSSDWAAFSAGALLTTINFILGMILLKIAVEGSEKRFMIILFGGIFVRMLILLPAVYITLKFLQIRANIFIFVIFIFYSFYLISEIFYFYLLRDRKH